MSRTLKHRPYRVQVSDRDARTIETHNHSRGDCDLAPKGVCDFHISYHADSNNIDDPECGHEPLHSSWSYLAAGMPSDYVRLWWTKPARQKCRIALHTVKRDFNTHGGFDELVSTEPEEYRPRHGAQWDWY